MKEESFKSLFIHWSQIVGLVRVFFKLLLLECVRMCVVCTVKSLKEVFRDGWRREQNSKPLT